MSPAGRVLSSAGAVIGLALVPAAPADDASTVYCLARPAELVQAAVALGTATAGSGTGTVAVDGTEIGVAAWRAAQPEAFTRTCTALRAAGPPPAAPARTPG